MKIPPRRYRKSRMCVFFFCRHNYYNNKNAPATEYMKTHIFNFTTLTPGLKFPCSVYWTRIGFHIFCDVRIHAPSSAPWNQISNKHTETIFSLSHECENGSLFSNRILHSEAQTLKCGNEEEMQFWVQWDFNDYSKTLLLLWFSIFKSTSVVEFCNNRTNRWLKVLSGCINWFHLCYRPMIRFQRTFCPGSE